MRIIINSGAIKILCTSVLLYLMYSCSSYAGPDFIITATNKTNQILSDAVIELSDEQFLNSIVKKIGTKLQAFSEDQELALQAETDTITHKLLKIIILADFKGGETKKISIKKQTFSGKSFPKRTQADLSVKAGGEWKKVTKENGTEQYEYIGGKFVNVSALRVPDYHTDHSFYIRYEGPGWESDKVGYRFYLDWRNATDIFGKKITDMILQNVGLDGFESYHNEGSWGMDILKVGSSLGIGSFAYWDGKNAKRVAVTDSLFSQITENGLIQSQIVTTYYGWQEAGKSLNLTSEITIDAGSRLSHQVLSLSSGLDNLCTGIVKLNNSELIHSSGATSEWRYLATFGRQSLNNDNLGLCIFYKNNHLIEITEDQYSHVVLLRPENNKLDYFFGAVWEKDIDAISTKEAFVQYLESTLQILNNPIEISY